ncbi:methionyl-tRNA formyltransferase [bacterium]|nr:methionyl-tRNA formyltransferase [bacterium]
MRVALLGTAAFAVPILETLVRSRHKVVGVVTGPDKPAGRGRKPMPTPVRVAAEAHNLPVLTPPKLKNRTFLSEYAAWKPDAAVVAAFRILPEAVFDLPPMGTINIHPSLLPKYRGPAPIQWALINGEEETGVTVFKLAKQVDAGGVLLQRRFEIDLLETAGDLMQRVQPMISDMLLETLDGLEEGTIHPQPQDDREATKAPKLAKEDGLIDWGLPGVAVHNRVRGLTPWPGAYTYHNGMLLKLFRSCPEELQGSPGEVLEADKRLIVAGSDGAVAFAEVQRQGKRRMTVEELMRGYKLEPGDRLGEA